MKDESAAFSRSSFILHPSSFRNEALMSGISTAPPPSPPAVDTLTRAAPSSVAFHYTQTDSFVALLQQLGASLLVSTYQANELLAARAAGGGLSLPRRRVR